MYFHGGKPGLNAGDLLQPGQEGNRRHMKGCLICEARKNGASPIVDPIPIHDGVYITTDREYGRFYAALSMGDLYVVEPVGEMIPSEEDRFPTFVCPMARVKGVYQRVVRLTPGQRCRLISRWMEADYRADGLGDVWDAMPVGRRRDLVTHEMEKLFEAVALIFTNHK